MPRSHIVLKRTSAFALAGLLLLATACRPQPSPARQLVLLVVEGLDHGMVTRLIAEGRVPHLARLSEGSGVVPVISAPGAESASAAASLATGTNPGTHGVFDAIAPDPATGRPRAATLHLRPSARWLGTVWREGAAYAPVRDGAPFWTTLGEAGLSTQYSSCRAPFRPSACPQARWCRARHCRIGVEAGATGTRGWHPTSRRKTSASHATGDGWSGSRSTATSRMPHWSACARPSASRSR